MAVSKNNAPPEREAYPKPAQTILLVEDNRQIMDGNRYFLERAGYAVVTAETIAQARALIRSESSAAIPAPMPKLMVLDIMLPDGNGLDFLRELRQSSDLPVLILTGLNEPGDVVHGLSSGADDYLPKPYDFSVLLARITALLRRSRSIPERLTRGALELDIISGQAFLAGSDLMLTPKQFALLLLLLRGEGRILSNACLYESVWKQPLTNDCNALWKQMSHLKAKLSDRHGIFLTQYRGEGYCLEFSADSGAGY